MSATAGSQLRFRLVDLKQFLRNPQSKPRSNQAQAMVSNTMKKVHRPVSIQAHGKATLEYFNGLLPWNVTSP